MEIKWRNKFFYFESITFQSNDSNNNLYKLNEKEFVTVSFSPNNYLKFWNLNDYSLILAINYIETADDGRTLFLFDEDTLLIYGINSKGFYLIKFLFIN